MDFGGGDEIRFERVGKAGVVTLTRPKALNALTHKMVRALAKAPAEDPDLIGPSAWIGRAGHSRALRSNRWPV